MAVGLRYVYTGNIHDPHGQSTYCHGCGQMLIERDWYALGRWNLTADGACNRCRTPLPGVFETRPDNRGAVRRPVRIREVASSENRGGPSV
jgi:pyruvate formate lyase activating enzyme